MFNPLQYLLLPLQAEVILQSRILHQTSFPCRQVYMQCWEKTWVQQQSKLQYVPFLSTAVKGIFQEVKVVCELKGGWRSAWEVRKHICWNKSMSIIQWMSIWSCVLLLWWALKADTYADLNCFKVFHQKLSKGKISLYTSLPKYASSLLSPVPTNVPPLADNTYQSLDM